MYMHTHRAPQVLKILPIYATCMYVYNNEDYFILINKHEKLWDGNYVFGRNSEYKVSIIRIQYDYYYA